MKAIKYLLSAVLLFSVIWSCDDDDFGSVDFVESAVAPTNISAVFNVTQDNTGLVTITPNGEGAVSYDVDFGDGSGIETVAQGKSIEHVYAEGSYDVKLTGTGVTGLKGEGSAPLTVSFRAPENLDVIIENDQAVSKQVNVTATADFAITYDVYFGEPGMDDPVSGNIGETVSYVYAEPGTYTVRVVAKGAAIATTEYSVDFEAVAIVQPVASAPAPRFRLAEDVISIYTEAYDNVAGSDYFPDWGQGGQGSSWAEFDLNGDKMLNYINLSYQGIQIGEVKDVSGMEVLHIDIWTADDMSIDIFPIPVGIAPEDERFVTKQLVKDQWNSFDIPLTEFTDQGLSLDEIHQFKFVGNPWAAGTVFIDNLYFWKEPSDTGGPSGALPISFESETSFRSFDGGDIQIIANPDMTGNTSANVVQVVKGAGQPWAGSVITSNNVPYGISEGITVTAKVWSPRAGQEILMKFEDNTPFPDTKGTPDAFATTTVANAWEEITWTITGVDPAVDYFNMVLIMDLGTNGDGSANYTIFMDDFDLATFLDFESPFSLTSFDGGDIQVIDNPDMTGNPSAKVAQLIKGAGQPWAGSIIQNNLPISIQENGQVTVKVWSPRAGLNLLMKFEDKTPFPDTKATADAIATTTVANAWEELTFTMTGVDPAVDYYNIVFIMDNGTNGDGSANFTIFIDDIESN